MTFDLQGRAAGATTAELRTAAALRWQRPLLTAELAEQACARAVADGDDLRWLQAAGWLLDGHAAGGDARDVATAVVAGVTGHATPGDSTVPVPLRTPGTEILTRPESARLRVELAGVAQADGELEAARALVVGLPDDAPGEDPGLLRLDRLAVEVRCALAGASASELDDRPTAVRTWGESSGGVYMSARSCAISSMLRRSSSSSISINSSDLRSSGRGRRSTTEAYASRPKQGSSGAPRATRRPTSAPEGEGRTTRCPLNTLGSRGGARTSFEDFLKWIHPDL